jgi:hypothetical protein
MNYPPTITGGYDTEFVPTDTILFEVPKSYNTALDLHEDDTFTISGASPQENGTYKLMGRPVIIPTPKATSSTRFRCWVRKQR